jgi:hypothetical protein
MVDDQDQSEIAGPGPYPAPFGQMPPNQAHRHSAHPQQRQQQQQQQPQPQQMSQAGDNGATFSSMLDPYDPMLDMDPFGLSASMHFPTQFTFDTSSMR